MLPSPYGNGLGLRCFRLSRPPVRSLALRPGDSLPSLRWRCRWASGHWFPSSLPSKLQGFWLLPRRDSFPAERASLRWTHFRTAGFPQYGSKAGLSEGAFPRVAWSSRHVVCTRPSCLPDAWIILALCRSSWRSYGTAVRAVYPLYPRGPRSGPGYSVPVHRRLIGPIRPTPRHVPISPSYGLYATPSLCRRVPA